MPYEQSIQDVIIKLDKILEESIAENSRLGFFAYVYRRTTAEIAKEIELNNFEDNQRMEKFDIIFANLYLKAYQDYKDYKSVSRSWAFAFKASDHELTIIQHVLFGMNAHINLDLAIAAAETMQGKDIRAIEKDFDKVNDILFQITNELQERLSRVSPFMFLLDWIGKNSDEKIIDFSMRKARTQAWNSANLFWSLGPSNQEIAIRELDELVLKLSLLIRNPKTFLTKTFLKLMGYFEEKDVKTVILRLSEN
jgi:hypothetical protein